MLLLRLSLAVAILASIGTFVVGHMKVSEKISGLNADLEKTKGDLTTSQGAEAKAKSDAKKAKSEADAANKLLAETKEALDNNSRELASQRKRADGLDKQLDEATKAKNTAQQEIAQWQALGVTPDQVRGLQKDMNEAKVTIEMGKEEKKVLVRNNATLKAELDKYTLGEEKAAPLPAGLKGKVLAVDPKYDFVVVDLGESQGVVTRGEMLVNRDGKLIAKIRVFRVEANRCVANVLPQWKQAEIQEGDIILN